VIDELLRRCDAPNCRRLFFAFDNIVSVGPSFAKTAGMEEKRDDEATRWPVWPFVVGLIVTSLTGACWVFVQLYDRLFPDLEWPDQLHIPDIAFMIATFGLWVGLPLLAVGAVLLLPRVFFGR
jgi:hypothetical protein